MANLCVVASQTNDALQLRTLVLRDLDGRYALFANASSQKLLEWQTTGVAVLVYLPSVQVQYRLHCETEQVPRSVVAESWQLRPDIPKRMDWVYEQHPQSNTIASRQTLLDELAQIASAEKLVAPKSACGLYLLPNEVERLNLATDNGVHDRRRYTKDAGGTWTEVVLVP